MARHRVLLVVKGQEIEKLLPLFVHPAQAVRNDRGHFISKRGSYAIKVGIVLAASRLWPS